MASSMLQRMAKDFDSSAPNAFDNVKPNDTEREALHNSDPSMNSEDIDYIIERAKTIFLRAVQKAKRAKNPNYETLAAEEERAIEYNAIIEEEIREFEKKAREVLSKKNMNSKLKKLPKNELKDIKK